MKFISFDVHNTNRMINDCRLFGIDGEKLLWRLLQDLSTDNLITMTNNHISVCVNVQGCFVQMLEYFLGKDS